MYELCACIVQTLLHSQEHAGLNQRVYKQFTGGKLSDKLFNDYDPVLFMNMTIFDVIYSNIKIHLSLCRERCCIKVKLLIV